MSTLSMNFLKIAMAVLLFSCSSTKSEKAVESESDPIKPIAELTYMEIWQMLLEANDAMGMDVHGDAFGQAGQEYLVVEEEGNCAVADCGSGVKLKSNAADTVLAVVKFSFELPGNPTKEMFRAYHLPPESAVNLGCSKFCYDGQKYLVSISVQSAGF